MTLATDTDIAIPAFLDRTGSLPAMVDRAAQTLASAKSAAEVLDAHDLAAAAYDAAKIAARVVRVKNAHDDLIAKVSRAQADALEIEAKAKRRLADEYDAAQGRGEIASHGQKRADVPNGNISADLGLSRKDIHEARIIRDAEEAEPGIIAATIEAAVAAGEEPTRAKVRRAAEAAAKRRPRPRKPVRHVVEETQHDRDLRMLLGVWEAACETARAAFIQTVTERD